MTDRLPEEGIQSDALNARLRDLLLNRAAVGTASSNGRTGRAVSISCALCGKDFHVTQEKIGRSGICPKCGRRIDFEDPSEQQTAESSELELAPNPFEPETTFEAEQPLNVVRETVVESAGNEGMFTPASEANEAPDTLLPSVPGDIENGSRSWPTVVPTVLAPHSAPDSVPEALLDSELTDEKILELPALEDDAEPIFKMDIDESATIWLDIEDEEDA